MNFQTLWRLGLSVLPRNEGFPGRGENPSINTQCLEDSDLKIEGDSPGRIDSTSVWNIGSFLLVNLCHFQLVCRNYRNELVIV